MLARNGHNLALGDLLVRSWYCGSPNSTVLFRRLKSLIRRRKSRSRMIMRSRDMARSAEWLRLQNKRLSSTWIVLEFVADSSHVLNSAREKTWGHDRAMSRPRGESPRNGLEGLESVRNIGLERCHLIQKPVLACRPCLGSRKMRLNSDHPPKGVQTRGFLLHASILPSHFTSVFGGKLSKTIQNYSASLCEFGIGYLLRQEAS